MKKLFTILFTIVAAGSFAQNVGIGETSPTLMKLQVKTADSAVLLLQNAATAGSNIKTALYFKTGTAYSGSIATMGSGLSHRLGLFTNGGNSPSSLLERISIKDNGFVGIGTTAATEQLTVQTVTNFVGITHTDGTIKIGTYVGGNGGYFGTISNHPLYLMTNNGNAQITLLQNGNTGIGTITPTEQLTVQTATNTLGITHTDGTIKVGTFVGGAGAGGYFGTVSNNPLYLFTNNGNAQVALLQNGNVGIGITNPTASLVIARGSGAGGTAQFIGTTNSSHFNYGSGEETYIRGGKATSQVIINDVSSGNIRLAEGGGSVGIGTATPTERLTVKTAPGNYGFSQTDGTVTLSSKTGGSSPGGWLGTKTNHPMYFYTADGSPQMTIATNGNVGIGTYPSNPTAKLKVEASTGTALEVAGAIKVSGNTPAAFVLVCTADNLGDDYVPSQGAPPGRYYHSVIIDNPLCNGDPNAIILVTQRSNSTNRGAHVFYLQYYVPLGKWKIMINSARAAESSCYGYVDTASPVNCSAQQIAVMPWKEDDLTPGDDTFNILVIKQ